MGTFQEATAVEQTGPGEYKVVLDPQWSIGTKLHGGYLLAVVARAAGEAAKEPHLTAISGTFPAAPEPGEASVQVTVLRSGGSQTQLRASLVQDGRICLEALVVQGTLADADPFWSNLEPADIPAEQDCFLMPATPPGGFAIPLLDVVEQRIQPSAVGFATGQPARTGRIGTWHRLGDGSDWDPLSLLIPLDPVPPITMDLGIPGWVPTLQMSAYIRRLPAPGSVKVLMHANDITGGRMDETALAWDGKGRLVAQATQFAAVRIPKPPAG
ncbi:thioesterase family protein [Actinocrispum sp. NPDC049592]|uniref:thioesterase family protein n=1 Tax=Actinocrispum sp. NPDC049592 TaxID=3154835 RepID=UPI00342611A7